MPKPAVQFVTYEVASLRSDVREIIRTASVSGRRLRDVGARADDTAHSFFLDAPGEELNAAASHLRGAAAQALALAGDLLACAGRLEQVAAIREAHEV